MNDYIEEENQSVLDNFNLSEVVRFTTTHDVQIIRGEDYQYICYIDKKHILSALTPMFALYYGIKQFKQQDNGNT